MQNKENEFRVFPYAYGQIMRDYLESGKAEKFVITNLRVRE